MDGDEDSSDRHARFKEYSQPIEVLTFDDSIEDGAEELGIYGSDEDTFRKQLYEYAWGEQCEPRIQVLLSAQHDKAVKDIVDFIHQARHEPAVLFELPISKPVPTAFIVGAEQSTSRVLSTKLLPDKKGKSKEAPVLVARVDSREAPTVKAALRCIISRLIACGSTTTHKTPLSGGKKPSLLAPDDMLVLQAWYKQKYGKAADSPVLAVFLDDLEGFGPRIIDDLFYVLSLYRRELPLCLVLGVSTSIDVVQRNLLKSSLLYIRPTVFALESGVETFNALIEGVFIDWEQAPLAIDANVYTFLRGSYESLDRSIDRVVSKIQYLYLSHFLVSPFSTMALALFPQSQDEGEGTKPVAPESLDLERFVTCPSLEAKDLRPSLSAHCIKEGLRDVDKLGECIDESLRCRQDLASKRITAFALFQLLEELWPQGRMARSEQLERYFEGTLSEEIERLCRNLRLTSQDVLRSFLTGAAVEATREHDPRFSAWLAQLEEHLESLPPSAQLQNGNVPGASARTEHDRWYTQTITEIAKLAEEIINEGLKDDLDIRFHEIWTYSDVRALQNAFYPSLLGSLAHEGGEAYERLQDAGKIVNLADWYQSLSSSDVASFVREVSGLAWQGFITPTKRKTEHVARAVW